LVNVEIAKLLERSFLKARKYLLTKGYEESQVIKKNPAGDVSRAFDIKVEEILVNDLSKNFPGYGVISEEIGDFNAAQKKNFFVIDPVDGSYNFIRKIGGASCSIALFENFDKDLRNVFFAFVGNYITGNIIFAEREAQEHTRITQEFTAIVCKAYRKL
jgi:fructose-1,6-bisphosphatase/inositol monophosphatase family enzyme